MTTTNKPAPPADESAAKPFWYGVLTSFPFIFLPVAALVGILCSFLMPYLTGAKR